MIRVFFSTRMQRAVAKLPADLRENTAAALRATGEQFGQPHAHAGPGLRKLRKHSYEVRVPLHWRIVFVHRKDHLVADDVVDHAGVRQWLKNQ